MYCYKLLVAYDGTNYSGWQIQPNGVTIQELIEKHLKAILRFPVKIVGSGRTDAGVHAFGQVAHFYFKSPIDCYRVSGSLNSLLPPDIRIRSLEKAHPDFHARYGALSKIYKYQLFIGKVLMPFQRLYCWHIRGHFDIPRLKEAIPHLLGSHDFTSFANDADTGVASYDPIRNLSRIDLFEEEGMLCLEFEADGFLYKMVRNLVGTLVEVGLNKRSQDSIPHLIAAKNRKVAGMAAPPQGLFLYQVNYSANENRAK